MGRHRAAPVLGAALLCVVCSASPAAAAAEGALAVDEDMRRSFEAWRQDYRRSYPSSSAQDEALANFAVNDRALQHMVGGGHAVVPHPLPALDQVLVYSQLRGQMDMQADLFEGRCSQVIADIANRVASASGDGDGDLEGRVGSDGLEGLQAPEWYDPELAHGVALLVVVTAASNSLLRNFPGAFGVVYVSFALLLLLLSNGAAAANRFAVA